jgi:hypothetical protein
MWTVAAAASPSEGDITGGDAASLRIRAEMTANGATSYAAELLHGIGLSGDSQDLHRKISGGLLVAPIGNEEGDNPSQLRHRVDGTWP